MFAVTKREERPARLYMISSRLICHRDAAVEGPAKRAVGVRNACEERRKKEENKLYRKITMN